MCTHAYYHDATYYISYPSLQKLASINLGWTIYSKGNEESNIITGKF